MVEDGADGAVVGNDAGTLAWFGGEEAGRQGTRIRGGDGVGAETTVGADAVRRKDLAHGAHHPRLEMRERLAVGQSRTVGVDNECRGELLVGLELLPGAALIVAEVDLAQARVGDHARRDAGDAGELCAHAGRLRQGADDVLGGGHGARQVAAVHRHWAQRREALRGRSRLRLTELGERVVALTNQRAPDVARRLAVTHEEELHAETAAVTRPA